MSVMKPGVTCSGIGKTMCDLLMWRQNSWCRPWDDIDTPWWGLRRHSSAMCSSHWRTTEYCRKIQIHLKPIFLITEVRRDLIVLCAIQELLIIISYTFRPKGWKEAQIFSSWIRQSVGKKPELWAQGVKLASVKLAYIHLSLMNLQSGAFCMVLSSCFYEFDLNYKDW